jgi:hypothetical protein
LTNAALERTVEFGSGGHLGKAAGRAGIAVAERVERAVRKTLEEGPEPAPPVGVEAGLRDTTVRWVMAEEHRSRHQPSPSGDRRANALGSGATSTSYR